MFVFCFSDQMGLITDNYLAEGMSVLPIFLKSLLSIPVCARSIFSLEFGFVDCLISLRKNKSMQPTVNSGAHISVSHGSYKIGRYQFSYLYD